MQKMISANDKKIEWKEGLTLFEVFRIMGYKLKVPAVMVRVNGELIKKAMWNEYTVPEDAEIQVLNVLRGG